MTLASGAIMRWMLLETLSNTLHEECQLAPDTLVLVGVSGGADSLCLLDALRRVGQSVIAAHFDHQLRPDSAADADSVRQVATGMRVPFVLGSANVQQHADANGLSVEEAARVLRYRFLFEQARLAGAQAVSVAHTADDQVETVLMHLLRGSGLSGLKGMRYRSVNPAFDPDLPLVRPLLGVWRAETEAYCREHGLSPLDDPSNADTAFYRNRLRHELIPYLQGFNPRIKEALLRTAQTLEGDRALLEGALDEAWARADAREGAGFISLGLAPLLAESQPMQRLLVRRMSERLRPGLRDVSYQTVERALAFARQPTRSRRADFSGGLLLMIEDDRLYLSEEDAALPFDGLPQMDPAAELALAAPGWLALSGGWRLDAVLEDDPQAALQQLTTQPDPYQAWIDADLAPFPLVLRTRRPGDRWQPLGLVGGTQKLSDFMINVKLPERARDALPLVFSAGRLVWLPGYRPAQGVQITVQTRRVLRLSLSR